MGRLEHEGQSSKANRSAAEGDQRSTTNERSGGTSVEGAVGGWNRGGSRGTRGDLDLSVRDLAGTTNSNRGGGLDLAVGDLADTANSDRGGSLDLAVGDLADRGTG